MSRDVVVSASSLDQLLQSKRYLTALADVEKDITESVEAYPFIEPQICTFIEHDIAEHMLQVETESNEKEFNELNEMYRDIIEDSLISELEIMPLEEKQKEMLKLIANTSLTRLIDKYEEYEKEEAAEIVSMRKKQSPTEGPTTLQMAIYEMDAQNKKLKKEIQSLENQTKKQPK